MYSTKKWPCIFALTQTTRHAGTLPVLLVFMSVVFAAPAQADPFLQPKGQGRIMATFISTQSPREFNNDGDLYSAANYRQNQLYGSVEYGLTDDLTGVLAPSYRNVRVQGQPTVDGIGYTALGARYRLAHGKNWVISTQGLLRIPGQQHQFSVAQIGNTSTDFDARLGFGYGTSRFFATAEAGYRWRSGLQADEWHLDLGAGVHLTPHYLLMASLFNTASAGRNAALNDERYRYGDLFLSVGYVISKSVTLQIGYTDTIYGQNALHQHGPFVGLWISF